MNLIQIGELAIALIKNGSICFVSCKDKSISYLRVFNYIVDDIRCENITCIAGHTQNPIFAFGDQKVKSSRIIVQKYPEQNLISVLESSEQLTEYKCIQFSQTEHIIALKSFPNYEIEIWNWRSRELIFSQNTNFYFDQQFIR